LFEGIASVSPVSQCVVVWGFFFLPPQSFAHSRECANDCGGGRALGDVVKSEDMTKRIAIIIFCLLLGFAVFFYFSRAKPPDGLRASFLDIGQGDAAYIEFENGQDALVDCGKDRRVLSALGRRMRFFDRQIDYLIVTHPDLDHYGGCVDVLKRFTVKHIVTNGGRKTYDDFWKAFSAQAEKERAAYTEIDKEQSWEIGSTTVHFLYPDRPVAKISGDVETNNKSIVFLLQHGARRVLFTGDAEKELEEYLIEKYGNLLDSDMLQVGHHGSPSSSEQPLVDAVSPANAVISVGKENRYGHPSLRVVRRLERAGASVWRTDTRGDIIMEYDNDSSGGFRMVSKK
jgi:competence protein ComEC